MHLLHVNGYDMAYIEQGAGAPLVLLHGAMCDLRYWAPQMETFGADGIGRSRPASGTSGPSGGTA